MLEGRKNCYHSLVRFLCKKTVDKTEQPRQTRQAAGMNNSTGPAKKGDTSARPPGNKRLATPMCSPPATPNGVTDERLHKGKKREENGAPRREASKGKEQVRVPTQQPLTYRCCHFTPDTMHALQKKKKKTRGSQQIGKANVCRITNRGWWAEAIPESKKIETDGLVANHQ